MKILEPPRTGILAAVAVTAFALFVLLQFNHAWYYIPLSDDAWLATTAKNWAQGYGWATSYGELYLFDPSQTTGPGLLGFIALAIKALGNKIWVPRVFSLILNLSLFILLLWRISLHLSRQHFFWTLLLLSLMFSCVNSYMWITSLGDVTAFLYIALSAMFMHEAIEDKQSSLCVASGIFAGLSLLTKTVAMVSIVGIMLLPLIYLLFMPSALPLTKSARQLLPKLLLALCATLVIMLPWSIYEHITLASLSVDEKLRHDINFQINFTTSGSGLRDFIQAYEDSNILDHLFDTLQTNVTGYRQTLATMLRPFTEFFALFIFLLLTFFITAYCGRNQRVNRLQFALILPSITYLVWLLLFGQLNYGRFIIICLFTGFIGISIALSRAPLLSALFTLYMAFSATILPPVFFGVGAIYEWKTDDSPVIKTLQEVVAAIEKDYPDKTLVSCSSIYSREVEYALPGANRVIDCRYQLGTVLQFDEHAFFARYPHLLQDAGVSGINIFLDNKLANPQSKMIAPVKWTGSTEFIVVSNPMARAYNKFGMAAQYDAIVSQCHETLYDNGYYALHLCRQTDLETAIAQKGGMELVPPQWQWQAWIHAAKTGHR